MLCTYFFKLRLKTGFVQVSVVRLFGNKNIDIVVIKRLGLLNNLT